MASSFKAARTHTRARAGSTESARLSFSCSASSLTLRRASHGAGDRLAVRAGRWVERTGRDIPRQKHKHSATLVCGAGRAALRHRLARELGRNAYAVAFVVLAQGAGGVFRCTRAHVAGCRTDLPRRPCENDQPLLSNFLVIVLSLCWQKINFRNEIARRYHFAPGAEAVTVDLSAVTVTLVSSSVIHCGRQMGTAFQVCHSRSHTMICQDRLGTNVLKSRGKTRLLSTPCCQSSCRWQEPSRPQRLRLQSSSRELPAENTPLVCSASLIAINPAHLPRQARDKHTEHPKRKGKIETMVLHAPGRQSGPRG